MKRPAKDQETDSQSKRLKDQQLNQDVSPRTKKLEDQSSAKVTFRLLCPGQRVGSVIGKGGDAISEMRQATKAKIKVESPVANCEDREIIIQSPDSKEEKTPAESALELIVQRIYEDEGSPQGTTQVQLLITQNQVGPILGKQGAIIADMRSASGANIRIFGKDSLPACAMPGDEVIQIQGEWGKVKHALSIVARNLRQHPAQVSQQLVGQRNILALGGHSVQGCQVETMYRLLVPESLVGSIIGKGGEMIRQIRMETAARIKIFEDMDNLGERIVSATSMDDCQAHVSAAELAVSKCAHLILNEAAKLDETAKFTIRLLVSSNQAGAIIGSQGQTIRELSRESSANIRVVQGDSLPDTFKEAGDKVLQIEGTAISCLQALHLCLSQLRLNMAQQNRNNSNGVQPPFPPHIYPQNPNPYMYPEYDPFQPRNPPFMILDNLQGSLNIHLTPQQTGNIIGPQGRHIDYIRQKCGAKLYLHQLDEVQGRTLEVSGSLQQIQVCISLVASYVAGIVPQ